MLRSGIPTVGALGFQGLGLRLDRLGFGALGVVGAFPGFTFDSFLHQRLSRILFMRPCAPSPLAPFSPQVKQRGSTWQLRVRFFREGRDLKS